MGDADTLVCPKSDPSHRVRGLNLGWGEVPISAWNPQMGTLSWSHALNCSCKKNFEQVFPTSQKHALTTGLWDILTQVSRLLNLFNFAFNNWARGRMWMTQPYSNPISSSGRRRNSTRVTHMLGEFANHWDKSYKTDCCYLSLLPLLPPAVLCGVVCVRCTSTR